MREDDRAPRPCAVLRHSYRALRLRCDRRVEEPNRTFYPYERLVYRRSCNRSMGRELPAGDAVPSSSTGNLFYIAFIYSDVIVFTRVVPEIGVTSLTGYAA
jgi:hypothetical protein